MLIEQQVDNWVMRQKQQQQEEPQVRPMCLCKNAIKKMKLFFKVSDKKLLESRNRIFIDKGIPALKKNGFIAGWHTGHGTLISDQMPAVAFVGD